MSLSDPALMGYVPDSWGSQCPLCHEHEYFPGNSVGELQKCYSCDKVACEGCMPLIDRECSDCRELRLRTCDLCMVEGAKKYGDAILCEDCLAKVNDLPSAAYDPDNRRDVGWAS